MDSLCLLGFSFSGNHATHDRGKAPGNQGRDQNGLYLLGHSNFDPQAVELMKLAALYDVQKRFDAGEEW